MESWWLTLKSDVGDPQLTVYIPPLCTGKPLLGHDRQTVTITQPQTETESCSLKLYEISTL